MGESHRVLREQVGAYALGQLSGERWRAVHAHLEVCETCRADLDEIAPVAGLLGESRDRLRPDQMSGRGDEPAAPPLSPELLAEVRAAGRGDEDADGTAVRARGFSAPRWVPVAAAAAVLVAVATGAGYLAGGAGGPAPLPTEAVAVQALDPAIDAEADLIAHTWGMEVRLTASGFDPGEAYVVTVTADDGRTVGAGEFIGTGETEMVCNLNSSVLRADASSVQVAGPGGEVVLAATV